MILEILKYPDPFLKTKAEPVGVIDSAVKKLVSDMFETMFKAKGIGLAATQVGENRRIAVLDVPPPRDNEDDEPVRGENLLTIINPEILSTDGETTYEEGCLSIPGFTADVRRASNLKLKFLDLDGKVNMVDAEGLFAIALQHEIDHLDGILFIDRLSRLKREMIKRKIKKALEEAL